MILPQILIYSLSQLRLIIKCWQQTVQNVGNRQSKSGRESICRPAFAFISLAPNVSLANKLFATYRLPFCSILIPSKTSAVLLMEFKRFVVHAFEREPGKWRASIRRADGKPVKVIGHRNLEQIVTCFDAPTAVAAILMAMAAIDAGTFARDRVATEKFWRLRGRSSDALATGNGTDPATRRRVSQNHSGRSSRTQSARRARRPE